MVDATYDYGQLGPELPDEFQTLPRIYAMGPWVYDPVWAQERHTSIDTEILYILRGHLKLHVKGVVVDAVPGDTVLVPNDTPHLDEFDPEDGLEVYIIQFVWDAEPEYLRGVSVKRFHRYCAEHRVEMKTFIDSFRRTHQRHSPQSLWLARTQLLVLLAQVYRGVTDRPSKRAENSQQRRRLELCDKARAWIDTHYREPVTIGQIAEALGVSRYYLSHVFSEVSDFTLVGYLMRLRVQKAKALLEQGSHNVSEAALAVGISNPAYLSRLFRRFYGVAPSDIR